MVCPGLSAYWPAKPPAATCLALGLVWGTTLIVLPGANASWENSGTLWTHAVRHGAAEVADLHNNLGVWSAKDGDLDAAVTELKQAVWLRPDYRESYVNLAHALSQKGELDKAITTLTIATWRWPDHVHIRGLLGKALFQVGRYAESADQYATIARLCPDKSFAHLFLGHVLARRGRYAEAADQYTEALRLSPEDQEARRRLERCSTVDGAVTVTECLEAIIAGLRPPPIYVRVVLLSGVA